MSHKTRTEEITEAAQAEMDRLDIDYTTENRIGFLSGMRDSWLADPEQSLDKTLYIAAVSGEISRLTLMQMFQR